MPAGRAYASTRPPAPRAPIHLHACSTHAHGHIARTRPPPTLSMHRGANVNALLWLCVGTALANVDPVEHEATLVVVLPASAQAYAPPRPTHGHPTHAQIHHTSPHAAAVAFALLWLCIVLLVRSCNHIQPLAARDLSRSPPSPSGANRDGADVRVCCGRDYPRGTP